MTSAVLREWSAGLRAWSRSARDESAGRRRDASEGRGHHRRRPAAPSAVPTAGPSPDGDLPTLDPVPVAELRELLVQAHGFSRRHVDQALAAAMLVAGYPPGYDRLGAADAFDLVEEILREPWGGPQG
ncbi:hypothetical protein [Nocardioides aquiterrae]